MMTKELYLEKLGHLVKLMHSMENTPFMVTTKVTVLSVMNMRYEKVAFDINLTEHPYLLTARIIDDAIMQFEAMCDIAFIENKDYTKNSSKSLVLEEKHEELWQEIWSRHDENEYAEFVKLKKDRLIINELTHLINGKKCVDFGCGNGSFSFAMLECGAVSVDGIDFGTKQVNYAKAVAESKGLSQCTNFFVDNVYNSKLKNDHYGFAVSNGVFHHLSKSNMSLALAEVGRVLKVGGWFWYYIDGKDAISMDLWDASVDILKQVNILQIEDILKCFNIGRNKMVHLMDGLSATYIHSGYQETLDELTRLGFGNFKRLTGGTPTDFDADVLNRDPYGVAKFGEGDLRILCQKIR